MTKQSLPVIPRQKDVITLEEGISRTTNWRNAVKPLYVNNESQIPHAVFIPLVDVYELAKLPALINSEFHIVGVRAYFSLEKPFLPAKPDQPIEKGNELGALLVPVYQTNSREPGCEGEFDYNDQYPTYDLIIQVPSSQAADGAVTEDTCSIYDITRPCPNLCDETSDLFSPSLRQHKKKDTGDHTTNL